MRRLAVAVLALLLSVPARALGDSPAFDPLYANLGKVPDFALTERGGKTVGLADLKGKVWIASFFFTACAGGCPTTIENMRRLQDQLAGVDDVRLVSFSVFPQQDTPERLREYAKEKHADPERWLFLTTTGDDQPMYDLIQKGFYQAVEKVKDPRPGFEVNHSFRVILVNRDGEMVGYVDGKDSAQMERLGRRARLLAMRLPLPAINAALNGTCALLLILGFLAVRARRLTLHIVCMLAALGVAALFLACYLYYHFVILDGKPTGFVGEGWIRPVYFGVLLTHTVLAAVVAPLALVTAYLGLRGRLRGHTRLARWTLPLWLYVSVTGVVVYWMLYHLYPPS